MTKTKRVLLTLGFLALAAIIFAPPVLALEPGALLYRTGADGKMFGRDSSPLIEESWAVMTGINSGHVAIYVGQEEGKDYIVEAGPSGLIKTEAKHFINRALGEEFVGARIPIGLTALEQAKVVALAKSLADKNFVYDFDFKRQKGPSDGEWTCVGLTEKIYESANIANPLKTIGLEYDPSAYAVDITPDGFDNYSPANSDGDRFSREKEFSLIDRRLTLVPAPEIIGFNAGREYDGQRYIFLPYTQFLQSSLRPSEVDIDIASDFSAASIRGQSKGLSLALRWSLINNPVSSLKIIVDKVGDVARQVGEKIFGSPEPGTLLVDSGAGKNIDAKTDNQSPATALISKNTDPSRSGSTTGSAGAKQAESALTVAGPLVGVNKANSSSADLSASSLTALVSSGAPNNNQASLDQNKAGDSSVSSLSLSKIQVNNQATGNPTLSSTVQQAVSSLYNLAAASVKVNSATISSGSAAPTGATTTITQNTAAISAAAADAPKIARINGIYATATNDWIELYNPGDYDFDLAAAGYRLERTRSAEDPGIVMRIGNQADGSYPGGTIIKARGTYLIVRSEANDYHKSRAQAIGTRSEFSWTGSGYTIYLGTGSISSSSDEDIVEAVGFGPDATYFQGTAPAPAIEDNYILRRSQWNYNNASDFQLVVSNDPGLVWPETGGSTGGGGNSGGTEANHPTLAIIQAIYATANNDWIELYNPGDYDFDLATAGYRLEKTKTAEDPSLMMRIGHEADGSYPGGTIIKARGIYLIAKAEAEDSLRSRAQALATRTEFSWPGKDYMIYLGTGAISSSTDPDIVDAVGFGPEATYFVGSGPAPEILDQHVLVRTGRQGDNAQDFSLAPINQELIEEPMLSDLGLYIPPLAYISPGLSELWHFDACEGSGEWSVGKWGCAWRLGTQQEKFTHALDPPFDAANFSLSFYYRREENPPRLSVRFFNETSENDIRLILEPGLLTVEGLPNSKWRYYNNLIFDDSWRLFTLVVNQAEGYWAVYLADQEIVRENFSGSLPIFTDLEVSGDAHPVLLDQLALWRRALGLEEIAAAYLADRPYDPWPLRPPQQPATALNIWNFNERLGSSAQDEQGGANLFLNSGSLWTERSLDNGALNFNLSSSAQAVLDFPLSGGDLSLGFWWKNSSFPNEGRAHIYLSDGQAGSSPLFGLVIDYYRQGFYFNGHYGLFSEGVNLALPHNDAWHYIVMTYDSYRNQLTFFVNGQERGRFAFIRIPSATIIKELRIYSSNFSFALDDLRIYRGTLMPKQIEDFYLGLN